MKLPVMMTVLGGDTKRRWKVNDRFASNVEAGAMNGTVCVPGPGVRTVTGSATYISNGELVLPATTANTIAWSLAAGASDIERVPGQMINLHFSALPTTGAVYFRMFEGASAKHGWYVDYTSGALYIRTYEPTMATFGFVRRMALFPNAQVDTYLVHDTAGIRYFIADNFWTQLGWISIDTATGNYKFISGNLLINGKIDRLLIRNTTIPSIDNCKFFDIASPETGTEYEATGSGDLGRGMALHIINFTAPDPLSGELEIAFRYYDADNYASIMVNSSGDVRYRWRISGNNNDTTALAKVTAGASVTLYRRMSEYQNDTFIRIGNTVVTSDLQNARMAQYWEELAEATCKIITATNYVVTRWRAWPVMSSNYSAIDTIRTGKAILTLGDSKTDNSTWINTLVTSLNALGTAQWKQWPGAIALGGWTIASCKAVIDAAIAYRYGYPDYVLMNFGSNDVTALPTEAVWKADYSYCIEALHSAWPNAKIYLAKPVRFVNTPPAAMHANISTVWAWIDDLVASYDYVYPGIDETDLAGEDDYQTNISDYTHYTTDGQTAVAGLWHDILAVG